MPKNSESGQAMVEFALVLPFLLLLICAMIDFGWIFGNQLALNNACREAARVCAINADMSQDQLQALADDTVAEREGRLFSEGSINVTVSSNADSQEITVKISCALKNITPLASTIFGTTFPLTAQTVMRAET